jgi:hypothetical protein
MSGPLLVQEEDPVELDGSIDATGNLQMAHGTDSLADYEQTLHAEHEDLNDPSNTIRIKLNDFSYGGDNWEITATHGFGPVNWSRGTDHAYYDFGPMSSELDVTITATSDAEPPANKQRIIKIKTKPTDSQR